MATKKEFTLMQDIAEAALNLLNAHGNLSAYAHICSMTGRQDELLETLKKDRETQLEYLRNLKAEGSEEEDERHL